MPTAPLPPLPRRREGRSLCRAAIESQAWASFPGKTIPMCASLHLRRIAQLGIVAGSREAQNKALRMSSLRSHCSLTYPSPSEGWRVSRDGAGEVHAFGVADWLRLTPVRVPGSCPASGSVSAEWPLWEPVVAPRASQTLRTASLRAAVRRHASRMTSREARRFSEGLAASQAVKCVS